MKYKIKFYKMHGLGNDFIFIMKNELLAIKNIIEFIRNISDRRLGIGCDQLITYSHMQDNIYNMEVFNHDGSKAEACGNGTRCLVKLLNYKYQHNNLRVNVSGRVLLSNVKDEDVSVNMGRSSFYESWMVNQEILLDILKVFSFDIQEVLQVDISNPHLVIFYNSLTNKDKEIITDQINNSKVFSNGVNIGFVRMNDNIINLDVWERGVGKTLSCGTGACAAFSAAQKLGFINNEAMVKFDLGTLKIKQKNRDIIMTGFASLIAKGDYYYE